jgi:hypothetical protein
MVPDEDPDCGFLSAAWPWQERDPDAILQPPKPELRPCAGVERPTIYEMPEKGGRGLMSNQDEAARRMAFFERLAPEAAAAGPQDKCDNPDCAWHQDAGERPGDGAAEVTMTEVYEDEP